MTIGTKNLPAEMRDQTDVVGIARPGILQLFRNRILEIPAMLHRVWEYAVVGIRDEILKAEWT